MRLFPIGIARIQEALPKPYQEYTVYTVFIYRDIQDLDSTFSYTIGYI